MRNESDSLALEPKFTPIYELWHMKAGLYNRFKFFSIPHHLICLYVSTTQVLCIILTARGQIFTNNMQVEEWKL